MQSIGQNIITNEFQRIQKSQYDAILKNNFTSNLQANQQQISSNFLERKEQNPQSSNFQESSDKRENLGLKKDKRIDQQIYDQIEKFCYFKLNKCYNLPEKSEGIIYFKQDYEYLYKFDKSKHTSIPTNLKQILITFFTGNQDKVNSQESCVLKIIISAQKITIERKNLAPIVKQFPTNKKILPQHPQKQWSVLQKRIWVQINKKLNAITVNTGDIQEVQTEKLNKLKVKLNPKVKQIQFDWKHCHKTYKEYKQMQKELSQQSQENELFNLTMFQICYVTKKPQNQTKYTILSPSQYITIKLLKVQQKHGPILKQHPSILEPQISPLNIMPQQIKQLYTRLKPITLQSLPLLRLKNIQNKSQNEYKSLSFAIHNSLVTPYSFVKCSQKQEQQVPIGILNHVFKVKMEKTYQPLINQKNKNKSVKELYRQIIDNRVGYIRFVVLDPKGVTPGNPAVLEIWPPFSCSPVHNHGQLYGVIKVLAGKTRVENFQDLSFQTSNQPYLKSDYNTGQYTWLSQNSYGLHRVLNLHAETCITLQGYYGHNQGSNQYFSFIQQQKPSNKETKHKQFSIIYPLHDWQNYLNKKSISDQKDIEYIQKVIKCYGLKDQKGKINDSFEKFCQVMLEEYEVLRKGTLMF